MFIAMNRFQVLKDHADAFESVWKSRDSRLVNEPGFIAFHLLKGPEDDTTILYASHTLWRSRAEFEAWTRSESFREAHKDGGRTKPMYQGGPRFEGFEVVQEVTGDGA